jgi:hypothetical protein
LHQAGVSAVSYRAGMAAGCRSLDQLKAQGSPA